MMQPLDRGAIARMLMQLFKHGSWKLQSSSTLLVWHTRNLQSAWVCDQPCC